MKEPIDERELQMQETNPSVAISTDLKQLLVKSIVMCSFDQKEENITNLYALIDKIYQTAYTDAKSHIQNDAYIDAAKIYLLFSNVLKENARNVKESEVNQVLLETAISLEDQAEHVFKDAITRREKKALEYHQKKQYIESTEIANSARSLEFEFDTNIEFHKQEVIRYFRYLTFLADTEIQNSRAINRVTQFFRDLTTKTESTPKPEQTLPQSTLSKPTKDQVSPEKITIKNTYTTTRKGWFDWAVYIEADKPTMDQIKSVTYTLHPTFPTPTRTVTDPTEGFKLKASGWGEFQIKADILLKNEKIISKYYWLDLGQEGEGP